LDHGDRQYQQLGNDGDDYRIDQWHDLCRAGCSAHCIGHRLVLLADHWHATGSAVSPSRCDRNAGHGIGNGGVVSTCVQWWCRQLELYRVAEHKRRRHVDNAFFKLPLPGHDHRHFGNNHGPFKRNVLRGGSCGEQRGRSGSRLCPDHLCSLGASGSAHQCGGDGRRSLIGRVVDCPDGSSWNGWNGDHVLFDSGVVGWWAKLVDRNRLNGEPGDGGRSAQPPPWCDVSG
jgi:hypothetical protein